MGADMIIGVGGGSALDTAKGIGAIIDRLDEDPYEVFYGRGCGFSVICLVQGQAENA